MFQVQRIFCHHPFEILNKEIWLIEANAFHKKVPQFICVINDWKTNTCPGHQEIHISLMSVTIQGHCVVNVSLSLLWTWHLTRCNAQTLLHEARNSMQCKLNDFASFCYLLKSEWKCNIFLWCVFIKAQWCYVMLQFTSVFKGLCRICLRAKVHNLVFITCS